MLFLFYLFTVIIVYIYYLYKPKAFQIAVEHSG